MTNYIKNLVKVNKASIETIKNLEQVVSNFKIENDKDRANFGNLCLILKANRIIEEATEAMLINDDVLKDDNGDFYKKIEEDAPAKEPENKDK